MGKNYSVPFKTRNKTGMSAFTSLTQHCTESPSHSNQTRRNKKHPIGKEEVKLSSFADDIILYIEKPKDSTKKLLELITEFNKVAGDKINIQIASKRIKYLGINLTKHIKGP